MEYVETLIDTAPPIIPVDQADHFVTQERVITLVPEDAIESVSIEELASDESLTPETSITVVREVEQVEIASPEQLIADSAGDLDTEIRIQVTYDDSQDTEQRIADSAGDLDTGIPMQVTHDDSQDTEQRIADSAGDLDTGTPMQVTHDDSQDTEQRTADPAGDLDTGTPMQVTHDDSQDTEQRTADPAGDLDTGTPMQVTHDDSQDTEQLTADPAGDLDTGIPMQVTYDDSQDTEQLTADPAGDLDTGIQIQVTYDDSQGTEQLAADPAGDLDTEIQIQVTHDDSQGTEQLAADPAGDLDTEIQIQVTYDDSQGTEQLAADPAGDLDTEIQIQVTYDDSQDDAGQNGPGTKVVGEDVVATITVREALERLRTEPETPLPVIRTIRYFEVMTLRELLDTEVDHTRLLKVITEHYRLESATLADLLQREKSENPDSIFYLHTVQDTDVQGIWGIIQFGLIDNFARGMAIRHGKDVETYRVEIPRDADETLEDRSSSFLGMLIDGKTKDSFVYNYRENRMGQNPDRILPGQEIVIVRFEPEELIAIYRHFAAS